MTIADPFGAESEWYSPNPEDSLPPWIRNVKLPWNFGTRWWMFLHSLCLVFSDQPTDGDRDKVIQQIYAFIDAIPCTSCRGHATKYINENPPDFTNRRTLFTWSWIFHNVVNKRLGKPLISFDEALRRCANPIVLKQGIFAENVPRGTEQEASDDAQQHIHRYSLNEDEQIPENAADGGATSVYTMSSMMRKAVNHQDGSHEQHTATTATTTTTILEDGNSKPSAVRTFWNSRWGTLEWLLVSLTSLGVACMLFCFLRTIRSRRMGPKFMIADSDEVLMAAGRSPGRAGRPVPVRQVSVGT